MFIALLQLLSRNALESWLTYSSSLTPRSQGLKSFYPMVYSVTSKWKRDDQKEQQERTIRKVIAKKPKTKIRARENVHMLRETQRKKFMHDKVLSLCVPYKVEQKKEVDNLKSGPILAVLMYFLYVVSFCFALECYLERETKIGPDLS